MRCQTGSRSAAGPLAAVAAAMVVAVSPVSAQRPAPAPGSAVVSLLMAEDARGAGPEGLRPILDGLRQEALRPLAIRAIGRLERPELATHVLPFLADDALREIAADAVAQSLRGLARDSARLRASEALVDTALRALAAHAMTEARPAVRGTLTRSLARLPFTDVRQAREAEAAVLALAVPERFTAEAPALIGVAHGLYSLARARRTVGDLSPAAVDWLRRLAVAGIDEPAMRPARRLAWLALAQMAAADSALVRAGIVDPDPQVRRLVVSALPNVSDSATRLAVLRQAADDPSFGVRLEWVRAFRQVLAPAGCGPLMVATGDANPHVRLAAIDALAGPCPEREVVVTLLRRLATSGPAGTAARLPGQVSWHVRARALAALARADARVALPLLQRDFRHPVWQVRMYVARGAAILRDSALLSALAFDPVGSVREVAIQGLSAAAGHVADRVYLSALESRDYHVVLAAARALRGTPFAEATVPRVMDALERLTAERRQTSRDPRLELLARVDELGDRALARRLARLASDIDPEVAREARRIAERLAPGSVGVIAAPALPPAPAPVHEPVRVRVSMAASTGGGSFEFLMDGAQAPMTVARVAALIRDRYYDGLTFHRVVPNFVVQGGSPAMNEYVGDGPFMRDELSLAHHRRGTLGISTRGRDTGDAQWFISLVDNYRLDHEYTVFAEVVAGMDVVDAILEGDIMETVRIVPGGVSSQR